MPNSLSIFDNADNTRTHVTHGWDPRVSLGALFFFSGRFHTDTRFYGARRPQLLILNRYIVFRCLYAARFAQLLPVPVPALSLVFYIVTAWLWTASYKCLFLPLEVSLGWSFPSQISRSEALNHSTVPAPRPALSRRPPRIRAAPWFSLLPHGTDGVRFYPCYLFSLV